MGPNTKLPNIVTLSRTAPVRELRRKALAAVNIAEVDATEMVLVAMFDEKTSKTLNELDISLEEAR